MIGQRPGGLFFHHLNESSSHLIISGVETPICLFGRFKFDLPDKLINNTAYRLCSVYTQLQLKQRNCSAWAWCCQRRDTCVSQNMKKNRSRSAKHIRVNFLRFDSLLICEVECDVTLSSLSAHCWRLIIAEVELISLRGESTKAQAA